MNSAFFPLPACVLICSSSCAFAATTLDFNQTVNTAIPDNNANGLASIIGVAGSSQAIVSVEVVITTLNGWNGDMYAYIEHNGVISTLLNRPGRTDLNPVGAASSGMQLRFADTAASDVHTSISGLYGALASGTYQPDARAADPNVVTAASPRSLYLSGFSGQLADGDWTLFMADLAGGDVATLSTWSVSLTLIPEPSSGLLALVGATGALLIRRRDRHAAP